MRTDELRQHICRHPHELTEAIRAGTYRPSPVLRTEIPKEESGKFRELGIPTVQDRLVQQAIAQASTSSVFLLPTQRQLKNSNDCLK